MQSPYMTQLLAQARIDAIMRSTAARGAGVRVVRRDRPHGRIRAWWKAQLRRPHHARPTRVTVTGREVATCSR